MPVVLLKLGGSLVTDKRTPYTLRPEIVSSLARTIAAARRQRGDLSLLVGNGAGSFGHVAVHESGFKNGVPEAGEGEAQALAYAKVAQAVSRLNAHIREALIECGVPAVSLPPSAVCRAQLVEREGGKLRGACSSVDAALFHACLTACCAPAAARGARDGGRRAVHARGRGAGARGGGGRRPGGARGLLDGGRLRGAGAGAAARPRPPPRRGPRRLHGARPRPRRARRPITRSRDPHGAGPAPRLIERLTEAEWARHAAAIGGSHGVDVTGGMADKVASMFALLRESRGWEGGGPRPRVFIAGGRDEANVLAALTGSPFVGTEIVLDGD